MTISARLGQETIHRLVASISAGQGNEAIGLARELHSELVSMQDLFLIWMTAFAANIRSDHGIEAFEQLWNGTLRRPPISNIGTPDTRAQNELVERIGTEVGKCLTAGGQVGGIEKRIQDDSALAGLRDGTLEELKDAIAYGELDLPIALANRMRNELVWIHDLFLLWNTCLLSFIGENQGDAAVAQAWRDAAEKAGAGDSNGAAIVHMSDERRLAEFARITRGHGEAFGVVEKDDHYDFVMDNCGSGGKLIRAGVYEGPDALYRLKTVSPMSYGQVEFPVYCAHCHFVGELSPRGRGDRPFAEVIAAENTAKGPCICRVYKQDREKVEASDRHEMASKFIDVIST